MKKIIRLTENDLHRVIANSVKRIINEVEVRGLRGRKYSLHGNDTDSWEVMKNLRHDLSDDEPDYYDEHDEASRRNDSNQNDVIFNNFNNGVDNESDIYKYRDADDYYDETEDDEDSYEDLNPNMYTNHDDYDVINSLDDVTSDIRLKSKQTSGDRHRTKMRYDDKKNKAPIFDFQTGRRTK